MSWSDTPTKAPPDSGQMITRDAKFLSAEMLAAVLTRFKKYLEDGFYDDVRHLKPLLTENEQTYIKRRQAIEREDQERKW